MIYNARLRGAGCSYCSLRDNCNPVPHRRSSASVQIVVLSPERITVWKNYLDPLLARVVKLFTQAGIPKSQINILYRTACHLPAKNFSPKNRTNALAQCLPHFQHYYRGDIPTLWLGRQSTLGALSQEERIKGTNCLDRHQITPQMVVDEPYVPYVAFPGRAAFYEEMIERFIDKIRGIYQPDSWPTILTTPDETTLNALRQIPNGATVGADIETLGPRRS